MTGTMPWWLAIVIAVGIWAVLISLGVTGKLVGHHVLQRHRTKGARRSA